MVGRFSLKDSGLAVEHGMQVTNGIRLLFKTIRTLKENEETKAAYLLLHSRMTM